MDIKFRAWNGKEMIDPYCVRGGKACVIRPCNANDKVIMDEHGTNYYSDWDIDVATDFPLMQCTGMKDKHGVDIFIGDIVTYSGFLSGFLQKVDRLVWANWMRDIDKLNDPMEYIEVVGNVHENPELVGN